MTVKICGVKDRLMLDVVIDSGAEFVGFVFFPKSPRHLDLEQAAALCAQAKGQVKTVALVVNPDLEQLKSILAQVPVDYLQLHGQESPDFCRQAKALGPQIIKAIPVAEPKDLAKARTYEGSVDMLLFDAKPSAKADLPGGNAEAFEWHLLQGQDFAVPWMLAGGLEPSNVARAMGICGAKRVDVSSGVESARGVKDADKIRAFVAEAKKAALS